MKEETRLDIDDSTVIIVGRQDGNVYVGFGSSSYTTEVLFSGKDEVGALMDFLERRVKEIM